MVRVASTSIRVERGSVDGSARAVPRRPLPLATRTARRAVVTAPQVNDVKAPAAAPAGDLCFDPFVRERRPAPEVARSRAIDDAFQPRRAPGPQNRGVTTF
jgi:hypothetical protein